MIRWGYNTNGFAHHTPDDAVEILADLGYRSLAITLDHGWLNPYATDSQQCCDQWRQRLQRYGLACVIETGARFLLDPSRKHEPTLVTADAAERSRRVDFYYRAIDIAVALQADCVSLWSGVLHDNTPPEVAYQRLTDGLNAVLNYAERRRMTIGFEPEPGMLIDTMAAWDRLRADTPSPRHRLTLDIGHLHCQGETPLADVITRYGADLVNVHIEDMRHGVHEHLPFGTGEIEFPPVLRALQTVGYSGGVHVELSRDSHRAPTIAAESLDFLRSAAGT